jgi:acyl-CoA reductase-like NAD-dependent aldehyde dehydrogenase
VPSGPLIHGRVVRTGRSFRTTNPATGKPLARVERAGMREMDAAVESSAKAFRTWSQVPIGRRMEHLAAVLEVFRAGEAQLAELVSLEQGKPLAEARAIDLVPAADALKYLARKADQLLAPRPVDYQQILFAHKQGQIRFEPLGVVAVITPWNFPVAIPVVEIAACLAAGNTVVFKPASATASIGLLLGEVFRRAGLPPGVVNVVPAVAEATEHLVGHPGLSKIMFTGSVETGAGVMAKAARNITGTVLELGGKDAAIVCADADLERAAAGLVWGAFANAGQACGSVERVYVVEDVADELLARIVGRTRTLRVGDPLAGSTDVGPMTTADQRALVEAQVAEAVARGARVDVGGRRPSAKGNWYAPTVLTGVDHGMRVMREETFGPVLPVMVVRDLDEAIRLANDSEFGLSASGWTRSARTAERLARELSVGTVTINDHLFSFGEPAATWGGLRKSGLGRSHAVYGLHELVNIKHVSLDLDPAPAAPWWYPYDGSFQRFMGSAFGALYTNDPRTKVPDALGLMASGRFFGYVKVSDLAANLGKLF